MRALADEHEDRIGPSRRVAELARELAMSVSSSPAAASGDAPAELELELCGRVLLDVNVGDVRCVVVRHEDDAANVANVTLSPREREIARMVALGYTNKTIARVLDISVWTVSTHLRRIFAKLGVSNRAAMVAAVAVVARTWDT